MSIKNNLSTPRALALSNEAYDFWNNFVTLGLPALGTFYFTIASIWSLMYGKEIVGTITALVVVGKVLLLISKKAYKDSGAGTIGTITVDTVNPEKDVFSLDMGDTPLLSLAGKKEVTFKVDDAASKMDPRLIDNS